MKTEYISRDVFEALRAPRPVEARFDGLWVSGDISSLARPTVAIVGTRAATPYGKRAARAFAMDLARAGCCVISGLAVGIDKAAHEGALEAAEGALGIPESKGTPEEAMMSMRAVGATIGILGGGHEHFYPARNLGLAERMIAGGGAVLSPFPPHQFAHPPQFLQRNGVVAALSDAVVVIEAPSRSGALNTATWAAGHIPVFAVPGDIDRPHVQGCLALIRDGAILARNANDILEVLRLLPLPLSPPLCHPERSEAKSKDATPKLTVERTEDALTKAVLSLLSQGEYDANMLIDALHSDAEHILPLLTTLEFDGRVENRGGGRFGIAGEI